MRGFLSLIFGDLSFVITRLQEAHTIHPVRSFALRVPHPFPTQVVGPEFPPPPRPGLGSTRLVGYLLKPVVNTAN